MALRDQPTHSGGIGWYHKDVGVNDQHGFFAISGVQDVGHDSRDTSGEMLRCDSAASPVTSSLGPYGFHRWNELEQMCSCGLTEQPEPQMGHHQITLRNISRVAVVMEALPYGYVLYFEMHDPQLEEECIRMSHSDCARTLQEIMRLMVEWDYAHEFFDNNELIATTCSGMLNVLTMPEDVKSFLLNSMPDEKVGRFLRGLPNAQDRADVADIPDLSLELSDWLEQKMLETRPLGQYR